MSEERGWVWGEPSELNPDPDDNLTIEELREKYSFVEWIETPAVIRWKPKEDSE